MRFVIKNGSSDHYLFCDDPEFVVTAWDASSLTSSLGRIEVLQQEGYYLGGWISYEAASALDNQLPVLSDGEFPLLTFLASKAVHFSELPPMALTSPLAVPRIVEGEYRASYEKLQNYIQSGDLYQANLSFRADLNRSFNPFDLFCKLEAEHPVPYAAYIETDDWQVISLSPELFLERNGNRLRSLPMKGTMPRGLTFEDDQRNLLHLETDEKNRAENLMIVDLMRNDLGKVCRVGSINTPKLFSSVRFPSLHQLVSEVTGELLTDTSLKDILSATFPAGSITGAPKKRSMEVIAELETDGRKAYTGSVGLFEPGGDFSLNVAIRTISCRYESTGTTAELGIGSGVVANSTASSEWQECLLKSEFLRFEQPHTEIFETMLWDEQYLWLSEHVKRIGRSCEYFSVPFEKDEVEKFLADLAESFEAKRHRVRLAIDSAGALSEQSSLLVENAWSDLKLLLSDDRVSSSSRYQYHKTNFRPLYQSAFEEAQNTGFDEVIFLNEQGQIAEGAISSIFLYADNEWLTPPIRAGILPGIWREKFMRETNATESLINLPMLTNAEEIVVGNSLRLKGSVSEVWSGGSILWQKKTSAS